MTPGAAPAIAFDAPLLGYGGMDSWIAQWYLFGIESTEWALAHYQPIEDEE